MSLRGSPAFTSRLFPSNSHFRVRTAIDCSRTIRPSPSRRRTRGSSTIVRACARLGRTVRRRALYAGHRLRRARSESSRVRESEPAAGETRRRKGDPGPQRPSQERPSEIGGEPKNPRHGLAHCLSRSLVEARPMYSLSNHATAVSALISTQLGRLRP